MEDLSLELKSRRRTYEAVCKYPGLHLREISRTTGLKLNLIDYHLQHLEKREMVFSVQDGQFKRYFTKDSMGAGERRDVIGAPDKPLVGLLRQPIPFRIVLLLAKHDHRTHKELSQALHRSPSTVSHHIEKLLESRIVEQLAEGDGYRLVDPPRIERILLLLSPLPHTLEDGFLAIWQDLHL